MAVMEPPIRRTWPRLVLTLPPETSEALGELARLNYRDRKREALRILVDGIERERALPARARP